MSRVGKLGPAVLALTLLAAPAFAADAESPPPSVLHLDQTAERTMPRDRLTIDLRTEATGADPRVVQAEINRRMSVALAKVKSVTAVKASSGNYQTYQVTPTGADGKPLPQQWHTVQDLILVSRDFNAALGLAGQLQGAGMVIGNMGFDVAPETLRAEQQALTDEALTALKTRAGQIAATLGLTVARIQTIRVGNATQPGGGPRPMLMGFDAAAKAAPPAVAAGDTTISVAVSADIALMPGK